MCLRALAGIALVALIGCGGGNSAGSSPNSAPGSHNEWTWVGGSNVGPSTQGTYGILGQPSPNNFPGSRVGSATWTDESGNLWLFGGGISSHYYNDLWKYSAGQWTWIGGSNGDEEPNAAGIYGTIGVGSPNNIPGARISACIWVDKDGTVWLFGGEIYIQGYPFWFSDLWKYSGGQWTWMGGPSQKNEPGVSGTLGVPSPSNSPGARSAAATWVDTSGNLWLFGGYGCDETGIPGYPGTCQYGPLNDLWKYSNGEWTWMGGSNMNGQSGTYGTLGVAAQGNCPGARSSANAWTDSAGNFWLFGGAGFNYYNDLWRYSNGQWAWMGGSNTGDQPGTYGTQGVAAPGNVPGSRASATGWTDKSGNFWLFGGIGYASIGPGGTNSASLPLGNLNDLWKYDGHQWTWMGGANLINAPAHYGSKGSASTDNTPGARSGSVGWVDPSGNFWLFGGSTPYDGGYTFNDLWKYQL